MTRRRAEPAFGHTIFDVAGGLIEASRGLGADEMASRVAAFSRPRFKIAQKRPTDTPKACVGRDIIEGDLAGIGDRSDAEDGPALDRQEQRIVRLRNPRGATLRRP